MPLDLLAHVNIRTTKLAATRDFYVDVLGMADGKRPPFDFPGHWLYVGGRDAVHLVGIETKDESSLGAYLGEKDPASLGGTGAIDHVAFAATGLGDLLARIRERKLPYRERTVPGSDLHQVFLEDPNGVTIELNFAAGERAA